MMPDIKNQSLAELCQQIRDQAQALVQAGRTESPVRIMEVCGTHTVSLSRSGMRSLLGGELALISGPGCPVCVTDQSYMDLAVDLAISHPEVTIATYGDMVRVPGRAGSLADARAKGADVQVVYAAHQALAMAAEQPRRQVVFLGIGFETTAPATALAVRQAQKEGLKNFSVLTTHKLVLPAMEALCADPRTRIDGFLCPGHVSVIMGYELYRPIAQRYGKPCVVAGFEPPNIAAAIVGILGQLRDGRAATGSVYPAASAKGNLTALAVLDEMFDVCDARWRALGTIPASGLRLKDAYAAFDAMRRFDLCEGESYEMPGCQCGLVITGRSQPTDCPMFGRACTPRTPIGPCMVSSEGSCSAYFKYHRHKTTVASKQ